MNRCTVIGVLVFLAACSRPEDSAREALTSRSTLSAEDPVGTSHWVFGVKWPVRGVDETIHRAQRVLAAMTGEEFTNVAVRSAVDSAYESGSWVPAPIAEQPSVLVGYSREFDDLRVFDDRVSDIHLDDGTVKDIGPDRARATFREVVDKLDEAGLLSTKYFDIADPIVTLEQQGSGSTESNSPVTIETLQYRFLALRKINGIRFANSGVRVAVHRSGAVSSIRIGGATIESSGEPGFEVGTGSSYAAVRRISLADLDINFSAGAARTGAETRIVTSAFQYLVPPGAEFAYPLQHYSYVLAFGSDDEVSISRRQDRAYRIDSAEASYFELTPPTAPAATGDPR